VILLPNELIILLVVFLLLLFLRTPIAFAMGISALVFLLMEDIKITILSQRLASGLNSFPLLAIPLYILAGQLMNTSGISERIFQFAASLVGHVRGGLGHVNILASMIFAGISGTAVSDAASLGAVEMKAMKDAGYDPGFSAAVTAASSAIGPIIPPSVVLIIYGVMGEVSIGSLFLGGVIPGVIIGLVLMGLVFIISIKRDFPSQKKTSFRQKGLALQRAFLSLLMPLIILGGIVLGITTPTEAGVLAVLYAIILGVIYREINWKTFLVSMREGLTINASIMLIVSVAAIFSWVLVSQNVPSLVAAIILSLTSNPIIVLLMVNLFLLILGMFFDTMAILIICTPIFIPLMNMIGVDLVHFGVIMVFNLMIGIITPPMGICLYIVSDVGEVPVIKVMKESVPFIIPLLIALLIITFFPQTVLWLPELVFN
jgi:tripartite ATP-independent transporter DctM subunit